MNSNLPLSWTLLAVLLASLPAGAARPKQRQMMKVGNDVVSVQVGQSFVRAQELITAGEFEQAANILKTILETEPRNSAAHYKYAFVLLQQGKNNEALEHARKCINLAPTFVGGWAVLGEASMNLHLEVQAREAYKQALIIQPNGENAEIIRERLSELDGEGDQPAPLADDPQITEQNRKTTELNRALALCDRAMAQLKQRQFDQGLDDCRAALKIATDSAQVKENFVAYLNNYAAACVQDQNLARAEELMKEAISYGKGNEVSPQTRLTALKNYAALLNFLNRADEARSIEAEVKRSISH